MRIIKSALCYIVSFALIISLAACSSSPNDSNKDYINSSSTDSSVFNVTGESDSNTGSASEETKKPSNTQQQEFPKYNGSAYAKLNNNIPSFSKSQITTKSFENYAELDYLRRCGVAYACIGLDIMPTEERGSIGQVKPSGWHTVKYDIVDGKYLYNRCHLIGFQLSGENANDKNLITGTRYLNVDGMLPFENMVANYIEETNNHVMYRVTPIFEGENLLCKGVKMEAYSVEDGGKGISFNVFCYNAQPYIKINYKTGESYLIVTPTTSPVTQENTTTEENLGKTYILNLNTKKFHYPACSAVNKISEENKEVFKGDKNELIYGGYFPCGICKP